MSYTGSKQTDRGTLTIFFGPGPHSVLIEAAHVYIRLAHEEGRRVCIGFLSEDCENEGIPIIAPRKETESGHKEFDVDAALAHQGWTVLVEDLAHVNATGSRNIWRHQDVEELLIAGVSVIATLRVQDLEVTSQQIFPHDKALWGNVPETFLDRADTVRFIDTSGNSPQEDSGHIREAASARLLEYLRHIRGSAGEGRTGTAASSSFIVCVGPAPSSAHCITWTARMARAFHAPWTALYVRGHRDVRREQAAQENLVLAKRLGAQCVTIDSDDRLQAVTGYALTQGVTDIVLGKSRTRKLFFRHLEMDFEDALLSHLSSVDIHIIPNRDIRGRYSVPQDILLKPEKPFVLSWRDTLLTGALFILTSCLLLGFRVLGFDSSHASTIYLLSVLLTARYTSGYAYGIASSVLSVVATAYFFSYPYFSLSVIQDGYPLTFIIMLVVALTTSALMVRSKRQNRESIQREWQAQVLYELTHHLAEVGDRQSIARVAVHHISRIFHCSSALYLLSPSSRLTSTEEGSEVPSSDSLLSEEADEVVAWVIRNGSPAGRGTSTFPDAHCFFLPLTAQGSVYAAAGIARSFAPSERQFLELVVSQVNSAYERQQLLDRQHDAMLETEREKLRSNLLRSISHDLRSPLTGMYGASSALLENKNKLDEAGRDRLAMNIKEDAQWLIRMVENLLTVTRIQSSDMAVRTVEEPAEEIIAAAAARVRRAHPGRLISLKVPRDLIMVPMDGTLISQVVINLIENAVEHSPSASTVTVSLSAEEDAAVFEIMDEGKGIAEDELPTLFEPGGPGIRKNAASDGRRGMGIGLSLCHSIIKAHHGTLEAANRETGGALFRFSLPFKPFKEE